MAVFFNRHPVLRRVLLGFMAAFALFFVLYWSAINYLLNREAPLIITSKNTRVEIRAESGWSLWPGVLHARGAFFQVQDYNIELQIRAQSATLDFAPSSALRGIVHIESLTSRGTRIRMLARVKDANHARLRIPAFPPLSNRPSYYDAPRVSPPNAAKLKIDTIDSELSELWMLEYHATGGMTAAGGVNVVDSVNIKGAHVTFSDVKIHVGDKLVADQVTGKLHADIGPVDTLKATAKETLKSIEASLHLGLRVRDLATFELYSPDGPLRLDGTANVKLAIEAAQGRLLESSAIKVDSEGIEASLEGRTFPFQFGLELNTPGNEVVQLDIKVQALDSKGRDPYVWGAESLHINAEGRQPDPLALQLTQGTIRWKDARLSDHRLLRELQGSDSAPLLKIDHFSGGIDFQATADSRENIPPLEKPAEESSMKLRETTGEIAFFPAKHTSIACELKLSTTCTQRGQAWACTDTEADCSPLIFTRENKHAEMSAHLEAPRLARGAKGEMTAAINFRGSNPKDLLFALVAPNVLQELGVAAAPLGPMTSSAALTLLPGTPTASSTLVFDLSKFESGPLSLRGHLVSADSMKSSWLLALGNIKVGVRQSQAGVDLELSPTASWVEAKSWFAAN
jgi:hypothetical protein